MITKEHILDLANQHLANGSIFVTGVKLGADNHISVSIDGDNGVTIADCAELSRALQARLDSSREDFALDVSSHGATSPLVTPRQYGRHIGRQFEIKLADGSKAEGDLVACDNEGLKLQYSTRENKPVGKGKITVVKEQVIRHSDIREARIKLKY